MKRKQVLAATGMVVALGLPFAANANLVFNPDGLPMGAPTVSITGFDWAPANALIDGGNSAVAAFVADPTYNPVTGTVSNPTQYSFDVYVHAVLTGTLGQSISGLCAPGDTFCTGGYQISMTMGFRENVANVQGSTALFSFLAGEPNFFTMYQGPAVSNALQGTGFDSGTLIASSALASAQLGNFSNITNITGTTQGFDQTSDGNQYPGTTAIFGTGNQPSLSMSVDVANLWLNPAYFPFSPILASWEFLNISLNPFFKTVNPSDCFDGAAGANTTNAACNLAANVVPNIGTVNGATGQPPGGPDIQLQTDYNNPVTARYLPEPTSLMLLGLGLTALGVGSRRRRNA